MLLTLYATGLRAGEVGRLRVAEVDLDARTLFVRDTKFFKSRLVPFSAGLADQLRSYLEARAARSSANPQAPFFINRHRRAFAAHKLSWIFHRLVATIAVARRPGARGPRLHDVRRTFAVHRVLRWYREGADVQAKLPLLATYMGHGSVLSTHVYLTATAELLREASGRFERAYGPLVAAPEEIRHEAR
jgi:integrase